MRQKVMLIDDAEIANVIMKKLINFLLLNVEVFDFTDSDEGYDAIATINPDIIFLDLNMPWLNGYGFLERMKADNYNHKVVIVTSSKSYIDKVKCAEFPNVVDIFEKPVNKDLILKYLGASSEYSYHVS